MANKKTNITKLIGAFNQYIDTNNTNSFADFVKSKKVGAFEENTHINIMEFNSKKSKYEEFVNYLIENYDNYKGNKYKSIAIRQIIAECLDNNQKITIHNSDQETVGKILSSRPVSTDKWHKTKYIARKTGKTLLMTGLLSGAIGAGLGLFGWGVGLVPGMTGNIISNLGTALTHGALYGAIIGPTFYVGHYLIKRAGIKKLGKKDKDNFNKLKNENLKSIADLEQKKIPLMQLVHDFQEDRQLSKSLRTSSNPFKIAKHRRIRDLNYIRFCEITESFAQLIDNLEKNNLKNNAKVVKDYYLNKFKSMFTHPDFARVADKYSIDKKLTDQNMVAKRISERKLTSNINSRDLETINSAFTFTKPIKIATTPKTTPKKPAQNTKKAVAETKKAVVKKEVKAEPKVTSKPQKTTTVLTAPVKKKKSTTVAKKPTPINNTVSTNKKEPTEKIEKAKKVKPTIENPSLFDLYPELDKKTIPTTKIEETSQTSKTPEASVKKPSSNPSSSDVKPKKKPSIIKNTNSVFDNISKEAVLVIEDKVSGLLKDKKSNLIKEMGLSKEAVETFVKLAENLHVGQNPITGKDHERISIANAMIKEEFRKKFNKDLTDSEYEKIMNYALGNVNLTDEL